MTPPDGARFQASRSGATYDEARSKLESAILESTSSVQRRWTVDELVEAWVEFVRRPDSTVTESTWLEYLGTYQRHIREFVPEGSRLPLGEREPSTIRREEFWELIHTGKRAKPKKDAGKKD